MGFPHPWAPRSGPRSSVFFLFLRPGPPPPSALRFLFSDSHRTARLSPWALPCCPRAHDSPGLFSEWAWTPAPPHPYWAIFLSPPRWGTHGGGRSPQPREDRTCGPAGLLRPRSPPGPPSSSGGPRGSPSSPGSQKDLPHPSQRRTHATVVNELSESLRSVWASFSGWVDALCPCASVSPSAHTPDVQVGGHVLLERSPCAVLPSAVNSATSLPSE